MNRPRLLLTLGLLLCGALFYAWLATPQLRRAPVQAPRTVEQDVVVADDEPTAGKMSDLELSIGPQKDFTDPSRNLFGPVFPAEPKSRTTVAQLPPDRPELIRPEPPAVVPEVKPEPIEAPPEPRLKPSGPEPLPPLQVLGYLIKEGEPTVFLSSRGQVYLVQQGDRFAADLQVAQMDSRSLTVVRANSDQQMVLRLSRPSTARLPNMTAGTGRTGGAEPLPPLENQGFPVPEQAAPTGSKVRPSPFRAPQRLQQQAPDNNLMRSIDEI